MSRYMDYDHAGWVQAQITATKKNQRPTKREQALALDNRGWWGAPLELNAFHKRALTILGLVGGGIYNCPIEWHLTHWWPNQIIVTWSHAHGMGTWDFDQMTKLMLLCHTGRIRGYIGAKKGGRYSGLEIFLSERVATGGMNTRHPNLEEAISDFQHWYRQDDPVTYPGDRPFPLLAVRSAIGDYHHALDKRAHGGVAAYHAIQAIESALALPWVQGASLKDTVPAT